MLLFSPLSSSSRNVVVETNGNPACHVILRGSNSGPNYDATHVSAAAERLTKAKLTPKIMVDWFVSPSYLVSSRYWLCHLLSFTPPPFLSSFAPPSLPSFSFFPLRSTSSTNPHFALHSSHGNSSKKHENQVVVAADVAKQLGEKETAENIMGVMVRLLFVLSTSSQTDDDAPA
jgi:3-deoxy-D-arabino-heptulosonate 7-phosphate (DAHP) synthase